MDEVSPSLRSTRKRQLSVRENSQLFVQCSAISVHMLAQKMQVFCFLICGDSHHCRREAARKVARTAASMLRLRPSGRRGWLAKALANPRCCIPRWAVPVTSHLVETALVQKSEKWLQILTRSVQTKRRFPRFTCCRLQQLERVQRPALLSVKSVQERTWEDGCVNDGTIPRAPCPLTPKTASSLSSQKRLQPLMVTHGSEYQNVETMIFVLQQQLLDLLLQFSSVGLEAILARGVSPAPPGNFIAPGVTLWPCGWRSWPRLRANTRFCAAPPLSVSMAWTRSCRALASYEAGMIRFQASLATT